MLINSDETLILSSFGYLEHGSLWAFDTKTKRVATILLSTADFLSLVLGKDDHFAVVHCFDNGYAEVTAHHFSNAEQKYAGIVVSKSGVDSQYGDSSVWNYLPANYLVHFRNKRANTFEHGLIRMLDGADDIQLQCFCWFDDGAYDKLYQSITGIEGVRGQEQIIVTVQRSSTLVIHDLKTGCECGTIELGNEGSAGHPIFRRGAQEFWVSAYDTLLRVDSSTGKIIDRRVLQEPEPEIRPEFNELAKEHPEMGGMRQFIGAPWVTPDQTLCVVPRPFSGDVIGVDPDTLEIKQRAILSKQPIEAIRLADGTVMARDWMSGTLLEGKMVKTS